jgi:glycine/D-amino acid oxidase-like deaminating enzyme
MLAAAPLLGVAGSREVAVTSTLIGKQAVVIGAGMGGLAAAGALADCFEQVFVLERDTLPSEPAYRVGTGFANGGRGEDSLAASSSARTG